MPPVRTSHKSPVWTYMERQGDFVLCLLCKMQLTNNKNTTSLLRHLKTRHGDEYQEIMRNSTAPSDQSTQKERPASVQQKLVESLERAVKYKEGNSQKAKLDRSLILMIVQDMQPFSVVEDRGFRRFVDDLDRKYQLPCRSTLTKKLLPQLYQETRGLLQRQLSSAAEVTVTTDIWTSRRMQAFLTATAHFITEDWQLRSCVLKTVRMTASHTGEHIASALRRIILEWDLDGKVKTIVTDNAANMVLAVRLLGLRQVPCFAHTLNLVVMDAIEKTPEVKDVITKVKKIVTHFHTSVKSSDKLEELQRQNGRDAKSLIQDVETRWNSTLYMFQRYHSELTIVTMTLCMVNKNHLCLMSEENDTIASAIKALEPFEQATRELSGDKFTTLSTVLPLLHSIRDFFCNQSDAQENHLAKELVSQLRRRFPPLEDKFTMAASTFLDPRYKKFAFQCQDSVRQVQERLMKQLKAPEDDTTATPSAPNSSSAIEPSGIWASFDKRIDDQLRVSSLPTIRPHTEMRRYNEEPPLRRDADPLLWWKENQCFLPQLQMLAKSFLSIPATSVPSERLFSKAGELVSHRRSCLKESTIDQVLFLNKNFQD